MSPPATAGRHAWPCADSPARRPDGSNAGRRGREGERFLFAFQARHPRLSLDQTRCLDLPPSLAGAKHEDIPAHSVYRICLAMAGNSGRRDRPGPGIRAASDDTNEVAAYWNQILFSGRGVPPPMKSSDAQVLSYVHDNPNAIGYVNPGAAVGEGLKAVVVLD